MKSDVEIFALKSKELAEAKHDYSDLVSGVVSFYGWWVCRWGLSWLWIWRWCIVGCFSGGGGDGASSDTCEVVVIICLLYNINITVNLPWSQPHLQYYETWSATTLLTSQEYEYNKQKEAMTSLMERNALLEQQLVDKQLRINEIQTINQVFNPIIR